MLPTMDRVPPPLIKSAARAKLKATTGSGLRSQLLGDVQTLPAHDTGLWTHGRAAEGCPALAGQAWLAPPAHVHPDNSAPCLDPPAWQTPTSSLTPVGLFSILQLPKMQRHPWAKGEGVWPLGEDTFQGGRKGEASCY